MDRSALPVADDAARTLSRAVPAEIIEQWMTHLRLQRTRARDMVWLIEGGATLHDGRAGEPLTDATARWLAEQKEVILQVDRLLLLYEDINV